MEKKLVKLKNGITFISQKLDNVHSVTISVNFKVGSLYEDQINNGITHLIEHLFFRQWDNLPQKQLYYEMQCMGAEIAAKTFHDYVSFSITVTPDSFIKAFKLITKCLNKFDWTDDIVKLKKKLFTSKLKMIIKHLIIGLIVTTLKIPNTKKLLWVRLNLYNQYL